MKMKKLQLEIKCKNKNNSFNNISIDDSINDHLCAEKSAINQRKSVAVQRNKIDREDPDVYIKKAFGKNFEFSEKYLTSNIKPEVIVKALKKRYGFTKITKATLKHVLYEGARLNRILRINDSCYEKMVEILDIPLDKDEEELRRNEELKEEEKASTTHLPPIKPAENNIFKTSLHLAKKTHKLTKEASSNNLQVLNDRISAAIIGVVVLYTKYYELIGLTLVCSKSCSGAILTLTSFLMFFMSHDLMTIIRRKTRCCNGWLDHYYILHRFCGYLMLIFAIIHSICHLTGSIKILSEKNVDEINDHLAVRAFDHKMSYVQLLFTTIPGITGIILFVSLSCMAITAMKCIREKCFQVFGYIHMALFPIFLIALIIHGFGFWFRLGTPFAIILITPPFILMVIQQLMRIFSGVFFNFEIVDVSVSSDCSYAMIYFEKPKNYKLVHGQYVFFNVPEVNTLQWHPFSVASSPSSPYLVLMVKRAGDWTSKLIRLLYEGKKKMMKHDEFQFVKHNEYDVFNVLHDLYQEIPLTEMKERNKLFFPRVKISRACATPNDTFIERKNVVMIGAGSGISPYLPLLEEVINNDEGNPSQYNFESARLIFVAREGEQISWVSNFLFHVMNSKCMIPSLEFNVYITLEKDVKTLPCFLFWRAFLLIGLSKQVCGRKNINYKPKFKYDNENMFIDQHEFENSPIKVKFGRPNFESIFKIMALETSKPLYIYSTTNPILNDHLFEIILKVRKETKTKIYHITESFS